MNFQYFFIAILISLLFFLIALWINKTARIFIWNYFAGFLAMISYLGIDIFLSFIDTNSDKLHLQNPDALAGLIMNNKPVIVIILYFIFFILFYKSRFFEVEIQWLIKKIISYLFLPFLTLINLIFTMMLVISGPSLLDFSSYQQFIKSLQIQDPHILQFLNILPLILLIIPFFLLIPFLNIQIKISFPALGRKKKEKAGTQENETGSQDS